MIGHDPTGAYVRLDEGDPAFHFDAGAVRCKRAAMEITEDCPTYAKEAIMLAISMGWLRSIAFMPSREHTWMRLEMEDAG